MANNYYKNQLDKVVEQHLRKEDTMKVRISSSHGFTHWMDLNNESAKELILWVQNNFPDCMDEVGEGTGQEPQVLTHMAGILASAGKPERALELLDKAISVKDMPK